MRWTAADLRGTVVVLDEWWELLAAGVPAACRPAEIAAAQVAASHSPTALPAVEHVESALVALSVAARDFAAAGYAVRPHRGSVAGIFVGDGGVPKHPVKEAEVTPSGLSGDSQRTRKYHGRVWQAVCLWSAEVVTDLQAEGHPVFAGACGENLSLAGIRWSELRPGTRMRVGTALLELSVPTEPCRQIRPYFSGGQIRRVDHYRHPGSSRWYATVLEPGVIAAGGAVAVEPGS